jgi:hypothetical protein
MLGALKWPTKFEDLLWAGREVRMGRQLGRRLGSLPGDGVDVGAVGDRGLQDEPPRLALGGDVVTMTNRLLNIFSALKDGDSH